MDVFGVVASFGRSEVGEQHQDANRESHVQTFYSNFFINYQFRVLTKLIILKININLKMKLKIGTHVVFDEDETLEELIVSLPDNVDVFQIYLGNKCGGSSRSLTEEDVENSLKVIGKRGFFIHSCLTNYLSCEKKFNRYCKKKIMNELRHVAKFPLSGVVIHPGTCNVNKVKRDLKETLDIVVESIYQIYKDGNEGLGMLILENSAGEGATVPRNLSELKYIIQELENREDVNGNPISENVGVCIDTCHIFAAGAFDFSDTKEIIRFKKEFSKEVGLKYLRVIHLNDSKEKFGSRKDRHEILGRGFIWKDPRLLAILLKSFKRVPFICETKSYPDSYLLSKKLSSIFNFLSHKYR